MVAEKRKLAFASNPSQRLLLTPPYEEALPPLFLSLVTVPSCSSVLYS